MMLTTKGRYAVMAMVDLASHSNGRPITLADISSRQDITLAYLEQIFSRLKKEGLVKAIRGPGGGYIFARPAEQTMISDIIMAVDEPIKITRCNNTAAGCMKDKVRCKTHDLWEGLGNQIYNYLRAISVTDVANRKLSPTMPEMAKNGHQETKAPFAC